MRKWLAGLLLVMYLLVGAVAWAQPQVPPTPTTGSLFVQDYAGVLSSDTKNKISLLGSQLKGKTKAHVVVVTVKSLEGMPISDYALAILRQWGVGDKTLNNGVVMVVAINDRQSRIEVGYGLEGALPDAKTGQIQDEYMLPYFQRGDYDQGILNGYQALIGEVAKEYNVDINISAKSAHRPKQASTNSWWGNLPGWVHLLIIAALAVLLIFDWVFLGGTITLLLLSLFRFRGGGGGGSGGGDGFGGGSGGGGGSDRNW